MATERLRRFQRLFGLLPLTAIVVLHLWEHSPIRHGRPGVLARLYARFESVPAWLEAALLMLPLLIYAGLGGLLYVREPTPEAEAPVRRERRRIVRVAGLVVVAFVAWHLSTLWLPARARGAGAIAAMVLAEAQLDQLWGALAYVLGLSAFSVLLGYAIAGDPGDGGAASGSREWALLGLAVGLSLWLWGIDLLAAYVAGAAVF